MEVDSARSNQHEFHAGRLRKELGLPDRRLSGVLRCLILGQDGSQPVIDEAPFTLYDAREHSTTRAPEWHLYYVSRQIPELARAGDLLVMYSDGDDLRAVVAQAGSMTEQRLLHALELGETEVETTFRFLDAPVPKKSDTELIADQLSLPLPGPGGRDVTTTAVYERALRDGHLPSSREMAAASAEILRASGTADLDADDYLTAALAAETDLFFAIERHIHAARLDALIAGNPSVAEVIDFALAIQQARRARRGQSLQNHFAEVLSRERIPFGAQCQTEPGETPDFVMPGCSEYRDVEFPASRLRVVACKSTAKERWRQVLHEAARVPQKYLLTLDPDLTEATLSAMMNAEVVVFTTRDLVDTHYLSAPERIRPLEVGGLIDRLREATRS